MDYTLTPNTGGSADLSYAKSDDLFVNVYLSLAIVRGSWWFNPDFGLRRRPRMKNTPALAALLAQDCKDALQWLLDNGRATAVVVTPLAVPNRPTWLNIQCAVTAATGRTVTYDKFVEVV